MPVGFQAIGDSGSYQIDSESRNMALDRIVAVPINQVTGTSNYVGTVAVGSAEVLALRSNGVPVAAIGRVGGNVTIVSPNAQNGGSNGGGVAYAYIFSPYTGVGIGNCGLQVFRADGSIVYDSSQKNLAMVDYREGHGDFYYDAGRVYAAVCCNQQVYVTDSVGGVQGSQLRIIGFSTSLLTPLAGGVRIEQRAYGAWVRNYSAGSGPNFASLAGSSPVARHLIVDITNF